VTTLSSILIGCRAAYRMNIVCPASPQVLINSTSKSIKSIGHPKTENRSFREIVCVRYV
jgi:hypothetical protein